jgi:hypothetical protein
MKLKQKIINTVKKRNHFVEYFYIKRNSGLIKLYKCYMESFFSKVENITWNKCKYHINLFQISLVNDELIN